MALRLERLRAAGGNMECLLGFRRWAHAVPLDSSLHPAMASPPLVLPEFDSNLDGNCSHNFGFGFPSFAFGGSMELMAVPKKKVSPHKRGIRNGPKALKPTPVIIRCRGCGRVKLQHFYCCSGDRGESGEQNK